MRLLRFNELQSLVGLSRSTIFRLEKANKFPRRIRLSSQSIAWAEDEVAAWLAERPRGMTNCR